MTDDLVKRLLNITVDTYEENETLCDAADRIEQLEAALLEKGNIAYIIDGHGITHESFTIVYREKTDV
jgi:hypothetical protein